MVSDFPAAAERTGLIVALYSRAVTWAAARIARAKSGCDHRKGAMMESVDHALDELYPTKTWGEPDDTAPARPLARRPRGARRRARERARRRDVRARGQRRRALRLHLRALHGPRRRASCRSAITACRRRPSGAHADATSTSCICASWSASARAVAAVQQVGVDLVRGDGAGSCASGRAPASTTRRCCRACRSSSRRCPRTGCSTSTSARSRTRRRASRRALARAVRRRAVDRELPVLSAADDDGRDQLRRQVRPT